MTRILTIVALVLFILAAFVGGGLIDPDPAILRWQVLVAVAFAALTARDLA